jgi:hypothetical protein
VLPLTTNFILWKLREHAFEAHSSFGVRLLLILYPTWFPKCSCFAGYMDCYWREALDPILRTPKCVEADKVLSELVTGWDDLL